jgi:hypothetical protein
VSTLAYPYSVRDSTNSSTDNRKTGLTPTVSAGKTLAASPATVLASTVTMVEVGAGDYIALYDAEANLDASFPIDWGSALTNPNDRYSTLILTRDAGRVLGSLTASGADLNLAQTGFSPRALDAVPDASLTVGDAFVSAISGAAGKGSISGTTYLVKTPSTGTVLRTFTLDSGTAPTSRS